MKGYRSPPWLFGAGALGGNAQTIWPALCGRRFHGPAPTFERTRLTTPDGDFIDFDWLHSAATVKANAPLLVLFHGLEGSSGSHYAQAFANWARLALRGAALSRLLGRVELGTARLPLGRL